MARHRLNLFGRYTLFTGVGGIGSGMFFLLEGNATLGRNESRLGRLLDMRDYCKLHIIAHYFAVLTGADPSGNPIRVLPIGKIGGDDAGKRLRREMAEAGMDTRFVEPEPGKPTLLSVCFQYEDGSGGNITTSEAAASALDVDDVDEAGAFLSLAEGRSIALAAGEAPLRARERMLDLASAHGALRAASFASGEMEDARRLGLLRKVDVIAINEDEGQALAGMEYDAANAGAFLAKCAEVLLAENPAMRIILSAGADGAYGFDDGRWRHTPAARVEILSTAGAGDALFGGTLAAMAAGIPFVADGPSRQTLADAPLESALDFGVLLATMTVTCPHTIHPDANLDGLLLFARRIGVTAGDAIRQAIV